MSTARFRASSFDSFVLLIDGSRSAVLWPKTAVSTKCVPLLILSQYPCQLTLLSLLTFFPPCSFRLTLPFLGIGSRHLLVFSLSTQLRGFGTHHHGCIVQSISNTYDHLRQGAECLSAFDYNCQQGRRLPLRIHVSPYCRGRNVQSMSIETGRI